MPQSISAEPLAQMVRSITLQKRTGVLRVEQLGGRGAEQGEIYFETGSLVRARTGRETGQTALQRINEWKQVTCSFQSMSKPPYSAVTPGAASSPARRSQAGLLPQTDRLARMPGLKDTEPHGSIVGQPLLAGERTTHPLDRRRAEIALAANAQSSLLPANQPLVLHGTKLETYTPAPPAAPARSVQRWTTHQVSELETLPMPRKPPVTPRLPPLPGEEVPPGRMAVFKTRSMVSSAQAIQHMERHARIVFILLDGRRTIQDIARLTHQTEYDVEQILMNLAQRGYAQYVRG